MRADFLANLVEGAIKSALAPVMAKLTVVEGDLAAVHTRLSSVEQLRQIPGPPGAPGQDGAPGKDGQNGIDGINGKDGAPGLTYCGVFLSGREYEPGQVVTYEGSAWHCNEVTAQRPGEGQKAWQLMVKHGRDFRPKDRNT